MTRMQAGLMMGALAAAAWTAHAAGLEIAFDKPVSGWEHEYKGEGFSLKDWWMGPEIKGESAWATESLPIGNGWFGASVFGWVSDERVQITHKALYLDPVYPDDSQRGVATLTNTEELKTLPKLTDALELRFAFPHAPDKVSGYRRALSLDDAVATVDYTADGVRFRREYFASYPDRVLVSRFTADRPGALAFEVRAENPYLMDQRTGEVSAAGDEIAAHQHFKAFNLDFEARVRVATDGCLVQRGDRLAVEGATWATVIFACDTNWTFDPAIMLTGMCKTDAGLGGRVGEVASRALARGYAELKARHLDDHRALFGRVSLSLDGEGEDLRKAETLFQYGRYLLIASSRPGTMPNNLQGTWNALPQAPWAGGIWMNVNEQMNYWPAFSGNLAECFEPLVRFIEMARPASRKASLDYLAKYPTHRRLPPPEEGMWNVGTGMIPFRTAIPGGHSGPGTGGFTTKLFWDWWDFTRDRRALERAYPLLRGMADFDCRAVDLTNGVYLSVYSASPEQRKGTELGEAASGADGVYSTVGCAFDQQMILENDRDFLRAHALLGKGEDALTAAVREHVGRLDPFQIGADGQLKEFREENRYGEIGEKDHRHISHLCALAPGETLNVFDTPEYAAAAKRTLELRGISGGWAAAHRLICLARLRDGEAAGRHLAAFLKTELGPNLWHIHTLSDVPVFQIDANFGFTAAVAEMLAQGDGKGRVDLLPAIPGEWKKGGAFSGLKVRGGYTVSCRWKDGKVVYFAVVPPRGGEAARVFAFGAELEQSRLEVMDMVHHNPGEPLAESAFRDPAHLAKRGYDAMVVNEFVFPQCACTFDAFDRRIFPEGSKARAWVLAARERLRAQAKACHDAGLRCYAFMDIIVLPKKLVELYGEELCDENGKIDFAKPLTRKVHAHMLDELFTVVPELDGIVVRTGETYLNNTPYHTGNGPVDYRRDYEGSKAIHAALMNLLREEVCVKKNRRVYYRTWDFGFFHTRPDYYLNVTAQVPVHSNFFMSVKHTAADYLRTVPFNPTLGIGRHRQVVEVQCQREYEGKGAFVNYVAASVIDGFEECADDPKPNCLADLAGNPLLAGVWTWSRGGGSCGPYISNELWCDMNATVMAAWAKTPGASERAAFDSYADGLGVEPGSRAAFRRLCLLSQAAIIRGRGTMLRKGSGLRPYMKEPDNWLFVGWFRDDALGGERELKATMDGLIADGLLDARLAEMAEACAIWREIVALARTVRCADKSAESYILTSALYGESLHRMMYHGCAVVFKGYAAKQAGADMDARFIRDHALQYDRARADLFEVKATRADSASAFRDDYPRYVKNDSVAPNNVLHADGLGESVRRYRALCGATAGAPKSATGRTASFADFDARARAGERLTVVFFGGSLTWSANASEPNTTGFRGQVAAALTAKYPDARFTFVDAAIGGTGSELGIFRLERDVLAKKPDLVFLDFSCNDGGGNLKIEPTCCYEYLLRRMIGEGIPVVQMFFTFKSWAAHGEPFDVEGCHLRLKAYRALVEAYRTGVGDVYRDSSLFADIAAGKTTLDGVWPVDGGHPCDLGYAYFAEAGIRGFARAVDEGRVCRVSEKPVFGTVADVRRIDADALAAKDAKSWKAALTYRTSLWYDGLPSRWMDGVWTFSGLNRAPLAIRGKGNLFGVFGEADEKALTAEILCDGEKIADFDPWHKAGKGRLFFWRRAFCGKGGEHAFTIDPIPDGTGEFRIGAVCIATVLPNGGAPAERAEKGSDDVLEKLDHARGSTD